LRNPTPNLQFPFPLLFRGSLGVSGTPLRSAIAPIVARKQPARDVPSRATSVLMQPAKRAYSMTSSARGSSVGGSLRPIVLAAGPNALRGSDPKFSQALESALTQTGFPDLRNLDQSDWRRLCEQTSPAVRAEPVLPNCDRRFGGIVARKVISYTPQRSAAVWTGASQRRFISSSSSDTVTEQPAMSSEVTKLPTSDRAMVQPAASTPLRTSLYIR
jgi:hypothetical protein